METPYFGCCLVRQWLRICNLERYIAVVAGSFVSGSDIEGRMRLRSLSVAAATVSVSLCSFVIPLQFDLSPVFLNAADSIICRAYRREVGDNFDF
mmetsp:Transcript_15262/g.27002  ORF Transcript_15262/g.27002 Transcript_15262/m.27002 type:complete len:95 (+) Transcript_15262:111-395(+)